MAQHKSPTQVQIASTATESEFRDFVVRYWKVAAIALLAIAAAVFARQYMANEARSAHAKAWDQLGTEVEIDNGAVQAPQPARLAELAAQNPGSDASVWAGLLEVEARIETGDFEAARSALNALVGRSGAHPSLSHPLQLEAGREPESLVSFLERRIDQESAWRAEHSRLFAPPQPEATELIGPPVPAAATEAPAANESPASAPAPQ